MLTNQTEFKRLSFFSHFPVLERTFRFVSVVAPSPRLRQEVHPHRHQRQSIVICLIFRPGIIPGSNLISFCKKPSNFLIWLVRGILTPVLDWYKWRCRDQFRFKEFKLTHVTPVEGNFRLVELKSFVTWTWSATAT